MASFDQSSLRDVVGVYYAKKVCRSAVVVIAPPHFRLQLILFLVAYE